MEEEYLKMQQKMDVLENTIMNLQLRDREIYRSIFNAEPPVYSTFAGDDLFEGMDTTSIDAIVADSKLRLSVIEKGMGRVNASIERIYANIDTLGSKGRQPQKGNVAAYLTSKHFGQVLFRAVISLLLDNSMLQLFLFRRNMTYYGSY